MDYVDIINENNEVIGRQPRRVAHEEGLLHRSVHIIIVNSDDEVLMQYRSPDKRLYPHYWAGSVAGHVDSGMSFDEAAKKEMMEEIGINTKLVLVGDFIIDNDIEHELVYCYFGRSDGPFKFDEREIEKAEFMPVSELKNGNGSLRMTPHCRKCLDLVFQKYYKFL